MHDVRIILAGKNETGTTHVGRELVDLVEGLATADRHHLVQSVMVPQVKDLKVIRRCRRKLGILEVDATNPVPLLLQAGNHVAPNESAGTENERSFLLHVCFSFE